MSNCVYKSVDMMNTGDFVRKESCMKEYINSDNGKVSIDESVVAQVAGLTALDCFGIVGMGIVSVKDGIVKQLRRDQVSKGVNVRFDENGDIKNVGVFSQEQKVIEHFMQSIQHENQVISQTLSHVLQDSENNELIAVSDTIKHCLMMAKIAAYRESTIMLYGESGAGKEVIARMYIKIAREIRKYFCRLTVRLFHMN